MASFVSPEVLSAAIAAIAAIVVAMIGLAKHMRGKRKGEQPSINVTSGRDAIVSGRDTIVQERRNELSEFFSAVARAALKDASEDVFSVDYDRLSWESFDTRILANALIETPKGLAIDNAKIRQFQTPEFLELWKMGGDRLCNSS